MSNNEDMIYDKTAVDMLNDKIARLEAECLKLRECPDCGGDKAIAEIARRMGHRPDIAFREVAKLEAECAAMRSDSERFKAVFAAWLDIDSIDMGLHTEVPTDKWDAFCELMLPSDAEFIAMQAGEKP